MSADLSPKTLDVERLSSREAEVFALIGDGLSSREIGGKLGTSPKTVDCQKGATKESGVEA